MPEKPEINLGFIGHLNHGKSSIITQLLLEKGKISNEEVEEIRNRVEKEDLDFSPCFILDSLREERERGVTIDISHEELESDNYHFKIIDTPGHRDFIKNTITGLTQAEVGVITVAADEGVQPQTVEHTYLSRLLNVQQYIVLINKMDLIDYEEEKFERVKEEVETMIDQVGIGQDDIDILPVSALEGENITELGDMNWYKGPALLEALNSLDKPIKPVERDTRLTVSKTEIRDEETFILGRVVTGEITRGDKIIFEPASTRQNQNIDGKIKKIEQYHSEIEKAEPEDNIALNVEDVGKEDVKKGDVAGHESKPPESVNKFEAQIIVLNCPKKSKMENWAGKLRSFIPLTSTKKCKSGYTAKVHVNNSQTSCEFTEIKQTKNPKTGEIISENPRYVKQGQEAIIEIKTQEEIVIEEKDDIPELSRFAIKDEDEGLIVGAGNCLKVSKCSK